MPAHRCVAAILRSGRRVLLCHRSPARDWFPNCWDLPGGHIEPGESESEALARELQEELGVVLEPPHRPPFASLRDDDGTVELGLWLLDYDGPIPNRSPAEHDDLQWFSAEELTGLPLADDAYRPLLLRALI